MSNRSKLNAYALLTAWIIAWFGLYFLLTHLRQIFGLQAPSHPPRTTVAIQIAASSVFSWFMLGLTALMLRSRGQRLMDLGLRQPGALAGWGLALAVAALYLWGLSYSVLGTSPLLTDWSSYRVLTALAAGVSAGVCEETMFRGMVMAQTRDAGWPRWAQVAASGLLFALAHVGWGAATGRFDLATAAQAMVPTGVLGTLLAMAYLLGRRSLWPVITAHAIIDLVAEPWLMLYAAQGGMAGHH